MDCDTQFWRPQPRDIALGRGGVATNHGCAEGNKVFRSIVALYREAYQSCFSRAEKKSIIQSVQEHLMEEGLRFVHQEVRDGEWVAAPNDKTNEKIAQSLREKPKGKQVEHAPSSCISDETSLSSAGSDWLMEGLGTQNPRVLESAMMEWAEETASYDASASFLDSEADELEAWDADLNPKTCNDDVLVDSSVCDGTELAWEDSSDLPDLFGTLSAFGLDDLSISGLYTSLGVGF